jgi:hypothetical protein
VARNPVHQFSSRRPAAPRLDLAFRLVRKFVSQVDPSLAWTKLRLNCREIVLFRRCNPGKVGQRAVMHMGHEPNTVCSLSLVDRLGEGYLFGLLLHEFGHLGSGGGEREADRWILDNFGIRIQYLGDLDLEWVDGQAIRKVLGASTPPRRNPHPVRQRDPRHRCPPRHPREVPSYQFP